MDPRRADLETEALYEVARVLSLSTDLSKGFTSSLNILAQYLGMENGTLSLFDPVTGEVFIEAAPEMNDDERILGRLWPGEGVAASSPPGCRWSSPTSPRSRSSSTAPGAGAISRAIGVPW